MIDLQTALACAERLENYDTCHDGDVDEAARVIRELADEVERLRKDADFWRRVENTDLGGEA